MKRLLVVVLCLLVLIIGCSKTNISGMWKGKFGPTPEKSIGVESMLKQNGKDLSGNLIIKDFGGQLKVTGLVDGNKLSFNTDFSDGLYISFSGIVENKTIKGKTEVTMRGPNIPGGHTTESWTLELSKERD